MRARAASPWRTETCDSRRPAERGHDLRNEGWTMDVTTDPRKTSSAALMVGFRKAPQRALLRAAGFSDDEFNRPFVGIANTWSEAMPCNRHLRDLADVVKQGIRDAGGTPAEFGCVAVSDGVQNPVMLGASLVSREMIADSIELG